MKRWLLFSILLSGWWGLAMAGPTTKVTIPLPIPYSDLDSIPDSTLVYTYWFDQDYSTHVTDTLTNGANYVDVTSLSEGYHLLHLRLGTGRSSTARSYLFYRPIEQDTTATGQELVYTCWFDQDYSTHQTYNLANGINLIDVTTLSEGYHILHLRLGRGSSSSARSFLFYKPIEEDTTVSGQELVYTCWFDQNYSTHTTDSLTNGINPINVTTLSEGYHTLHLRLGTGAKSSLRSHLFYKPLEQDSAAIDTSQSTLVYWFDGETTPHKISPALGSHIIVPPAIECGEQGYIHTALKVGGRYVTSVRSHRFVMMDSVCCIAPLYVTVDSITETGARIHWAYNREENFSIAIDTIPFSPDSTTPTLSLTDTVYRFTDLHSAKDYYYAVKTDCDTHSNPWVTGTWTTICRTLTQTVVATCDNYTWRGQDYTQSGVYRDTVVSVNGYDETCDSIYELQLTLHYSDSAMVDVTACRNYTWHDSTYTVSTDTARFETTTRHGCDSLVTLHLTVNNNTYPDSTVYDTACGYYSWHGQTYTSTGEYTYTHQYADSPCPSIDTLRLTVYPMYDIHQYAAIFEGDSTWFDGNWYTLAGVYRDSLVSVNGCDSIRTLHVSIKPVGVQIEQASVCQGVAYNGNHFQVPESVTAVSTGVLMMRDTLRSRGFDSIIFGLDLTVIPSQLSAPTGLVPVADSVIAHGDVVLTWNAVAGAAGYRLFVWKTDQPEPTAPSYYTTQLYKIVTNYENYSIYRWRVEAMNPCDTETSATQIFAVYKQPILTLGSHVLAFGEVEYNATARQTLRMTGRDLTDSIRLSLHGMDAALFGLSTNAVSRFGGSVEVSFTPAVLQRSFDAYLIVQSGTVRDTVTLSGLLSNYYVFSVNVSSSLLPPATPVPITGTLTNATGAAESNVPVDVWVRVMGRVVVITDTTDAQGHFGMTYTPVYSECGFYEVGACLHDNENRPTLTSFNIPGISFTGNTWPVWEITQNDTLRGSIPVKNRCSVPLHDIVVRVDSLPSGVILRFDTLTLPPFANGSLTFTLVGSIPSLGNQYENIRLSASCMEGLLGGILAYYYCFKPIADLQISFDTLVCAAVPGEQKVVDIALYNNTDSIFRNVCLYLPQGLTGMGLLHADSVYNIPPRDSLFIPLLLNFPEGTLLAPITGQMVLSASNALPQYLPFTVNVVSNASGSLRVLVSNEYTYYNNGPHVSGASVTVIGYYTLDTVAMGVTGSNGQIIFDSLPEGYYNLYVSAPDNNSYSSVIQIRAGHQTFEDVDLEFQAVTYSWEVQQVGMEDNWTVHLNAEYKTNVPKPVLGLSVPQFNAPWDGSFTTTNIVVTNYGLIDAYDATLIVPESECYDFVPLFDKIDTLPALSSRIIPCSIRNRVIWDSILRVCPDSTCIKDTGYVERTRIIIRTWWQDSIIRIPVRRYVNDTIQKDTIIYDSVYTRVPRQQIDTLVDSTISRIVYYDTIISDTLIVLSDEWEAVYGSCETFPFRVYAHWRCNEENKWVYAGTTTEKIDCSKPKDDALDEVGGLNGFLGSEFIPASFGWAYTFPYYRPTPGSTQHGYHASANSPKPPINNNPRDCGPCWNNEAKEAKDCMSEFNQWQESQTPPPQPQNAPRTMQKNNDDNVEDEWIETQNIPGDLIGLPHPISGGTFRCMAEATDNITSCGENIQIPSGYIYHGRKADSCSFERSVQLAKTYCDTLRKIRHRIVYGEDTTIIPNESTVDSIIRYLVIDTIERHIKIKHIKITIIHTVDSFIKERCIARWDTITEYIGRYGELPTILVDYSYFSSQTLHVLDSIKHEAEKIGFASVAEMFSATLDSLLLYPKKKSVCAGVSLQFSQEVAMTREAFEGVLTIKNPHDTAALRNLSLAFSVTDTAGHDCSDKFDISILRQEGVGADSSIAPGATGTVTVRFVPLMSAAPTDSVPYLFGGTVDYTNPYTHLDVSDNLRPVRLIVSPSPHLRLDYFVPHDIIADDPLTAPMIESAVPATVGLRVLNDGMGIARNVRLSALSLQITENRQGLAVNFSMLNTIRNGAGFSLPLGDISLGAINPQNTQTLEYSFVSSLLGTLTVRDVEVIHNSSVDDRDMNLVDAYAHRLVHPVMEYKAGSDSIHDFLTDDVANGLDRPDSLFFSTGRADPVLMADSTIFNHYVEELDTMVQVTLYPDTIGWNYGTTADPGRGKYEIVSCVRDDNVRIPLDNVWLTFVDLPDELDPVYVNKLHLLDTLLEMRPTVYNVTFRRLPGLLMVDSITHLPQVDTYIPVDSFVVHFNKGVIDTTFTYADLSLKCNNGGELMDSTVTVTRLDDTTFSVDISRKTYGFGLYILKVMADGIRDLSGHYGIGGMEAHWVRTTCDPYYDSISLSVCDSLLWQDTLLTASGIYYDTLPGMYGCDTILVLNLTVNYSNTAIEAITTCDSLTWHGTAYTASTTTPTFTSLNVVGCDSVTTLYLTVNYSNTAIETLTTCDSLTWHGQSYSASTATPTFTSMNAVGCDSVTTLNLTVNYSNAAIETLTTCDSLTWHGATYATSTNTPTFTSLNSAGCDSVTTLHLTVNYSNTAIETLTTCDSLTWHGQSYTTTTSTPTFTSLNAAGCDSVTTLHLTVNYSNAAIETLTTCDSLTWHGQSYTSSTSTPTFTSLNAAGCDSVTTLHLTVNYSNTGTETLTTCDSLTWHGQSYTASISTPTFTSLNAAGCDSVTTLHLTVNYSNTSIETVTACNSYVWHGTEYTASTNTPTYTTTNAVGCDSVVTLHLTIIECSTTAITACDSYTWHGVTYTSGGTYMDGTDTLVLTLNYSTSATETVTTCDSYTWHGTTFTTTGTVTDTLTNAAGCDSMTTLNLTVNYSNTGVETITACNSFVWHGTEYTASTNTPTYTTTNIVGCDSVTTLLLTIIECSTTTITACDSYTWHDSTYTVSGLYTDGADTLDLTIHYSTIGTETLAACDSINWHGNTYTASTSTPTFDTLNVWECDSTVRLNLTIHYSVHDTLTETAVDSFLWDRRTLTESGIYYYEGLTGEGCDSIVVLNLIVTHDSTFINLPDGRDIRVYPNPTAGWLTIEAENVMEIRVFDNQGKRVKVFLKTNPIDLTDLPTGQYLLHIILHDGSGVKKVIKQ